MPADPFTEDDRQRADALLADEGTHDPDCWLAHNACWAARIRRTLEGITDHA